MMVRTLVRGLPAIAIFVALGCAGHRPDREEAKARYDALRERWSEEAEAKAYSSSVNDRWNGPAGAGIIAMGKAALPFVMEELGRGNFFFNVPAQHITGRSVGEGASISEQARCGLWVEWWAKNSCDPRWNPFLK